jgi:GntR family transcriptional regulator
VDDRPVGLHDAYLTRRDILRPDLLRVGSLYSLLEQMGVQLAEAEEHLDAIIADAALAGLLKVPKGAPLLQVSRITRDQNHVPIEVVHAIYRANFYRYTVKLYR